MSLFEHPEVGAAPEPTWSVGELADAVGNAVRARFRDEVWVRGEIHDLSRPPSGHVYLMLVEVRDDGSRACLPVMLSARNKPAVNRSLTSVGGAVRMVDGTEVRIRGRIDWYEPRGQVQLRMTAIDPAYTLGQLELARAELLARLDAEGLLRANAGRALAEVPLRVGLVTSRGSAAEADFLHELSGSGFGFRVTVVDTRVQGQGSPGAIRAALAALAARHVDVIALARGGGARTDLAAFDSELLARAIAACPIPVITGVGHEIDRSVADEVAHTSAKTPTACAAMLVERVATHLRGMEDRWTAIAAVAGRELDGHEQRLRGHARHLASGTRGALALADSGLRQAAGRSRRGAGTTLDRAAARTSLAAGRIEGGARRNLRSAALAEHTAERRLTVRAPRALAAADREQASLQARLRAHDPERILARGWSITRRDDGSVVRSPADVSPGDRLSTLLAGGEVRSTVDDPGAHE